MELGLKTSIGNENVHSMSTADRNGNINCEAISDTKNEEQFHPVQPSLDKFPKLEIYATFVAASSFLCTGLLRAYTSPALVSMREESGLLNSTFLPEKELISWIASSPPLASFVGTIISGPLLQYFGRQKTILFLTLPFILGWLLLGFAKNATMILAGRISTGFSAGLATAASQVYVSECVRAKVRGTLGFLPPMMLALGILIGFAAGTLQLEWRELAFVMGAFPVILLFLAYSIPESPTWLLGRNRKSEAIKSLTSLRAGTGTSAEDIQMEMDQLDAILKSSTKQNLNGGSFLATISRKEIWFSALISTGLMIFQQFSGPNCVIFYLTLILEDNLPMHSKIFEDSPPHYLDPHVGALIVASIQFVAFFVSLPLIDRLGRKVLLITSAILMAIAHGLMGAYFYWLNENSSSFVRGISTWFPIACLSMFIAAYSIGFGPIPFLIMSEIFPSHARSYLVSLASFVNHLAIFVAIYMFPTLLHSFDPSFTFWMFGVCVLVSIVFVTLLVPETKGKTLVEIELELSGRKILITRL